jgi:proline dehydrogenase
MAPPRVELLATPDCPHAGRARAAVERLLADEGIETPVRYVIVRSLEEAESSDFRGSPTIRVDGRDVDPPPAMLPVNLGCRVYPGGDGSVEGIPAEHRIRAALRGAPEPAEGAAPDPAGPPGDGAGPDLRDVPANVSRAFFLWASRRDSLRRLAMSTPLTRGLVARFVAGETLEEALAALARLRATGLRTTVDVLGESAESDLAARQAAERYVETLDSLAPEGFDGNVSLKLTQMGLDIDAGLCRENVTLVLERARETDAFVRIDMEDHTKTDATLALARELRTSYPELGVVIQSYMRRSAGDVEALIAERTRVRLCKGAYDEPASVAFATKAEVDESYRQLTERLLLRGTYPAIATHDERLIDHARRFAADHDVAPSRFEFQMLYGVRRDLQRRLVRDGYTVRVYVPYGAEWYPYFMRRLAERPANLLFVLRSVMREGREQGSRAA